VFHETYSKIIQEILTSTYLIQPGTVAHTYNPSYSGDGDREDPDPRTAWARSWWDHYLNKQVPAMWKTYIERQPSKAILSKKHNETLPEKTPKAKKTRDVIQDVEGLLASMRSWIPRREKEREKERERERKEEGERKRERGGREAQREGQREREKGRERERVLVLVRNLSHWVLNNVKCWG
jgi:hypothetical protein